MNTSVVFLVFLAVFATMAAGQRFPRIKPGDCPPPISTQSYTEPCRGDAQCPAQEKCCGTSVGGTLCVMPVTMRSASQEKGKGGRCPLKPTGAWVCSNTCTYDIDCRGRSKCCRGRCPGSMICQKPEM